VDEMGVNGEHLPFTLQPLKVWPLLLLGDPSPFTRRPLKASGGDEMGVKGQVGRG